MNYLSKRFIYLRFQFPFYNYRYRYVIRLSIPGGLQCAGDLASGIDIPIEVEGHYFNLVKAVWEPILESWQMQFHVSIEKNSSIDVFG